MSKKIAIVDCETTGLDPYFSRIIVINVSVFRNYPDHRVENKIIIKEDERKILEEFWEIIKDIDYLIGFNILNFDWFFLKMRSLKHRLPISKNFQPSEIFDLMFLLSPYRKWKRLSDLAEFLDLGHKNSGGKMLELWEQKKFDKIKEYSKEEMEILTKIFTYAEWSNLIRIE